MPEWILNIESRILLLYYKYFLIEVGSEYQMPEIRIHPVVGVRMKRQKIGKVVFIRLQAGGSGSTIRASGHSVPNALVNTIKQNAAVLKSHSRTMSLISQEETQISLSLPMADGLNS